MKTVRTLLKLFMILAVMPALAGAGIMMLWNGIVVQVCGFAAIGFWQSIGMFVLGQLLSGGFILGIALAAGVFHLHAHHHGEMPEHWHNMSDEQRRDFIERRRREHAGSYKYGRQGGEDA